MTVFIRDPQTHKNIPVPDRLEPAFNYVDKNGLSIQFRDNGVYEIHDAPTSTLNRFLQRFLRDTHLTLNKEEIVFLKTKLGIDAEHGFTINPAVSKKWIEPWSLDLNSSAKEAQKINAKKIEVVFENRADMSPDDIAFMSARLVAILKKVAIASGLKANQIPSVIRIKDGVNMMTTESDEAPYQKLLQRCSAASAQASTNKALPAPQDLPKLHDVAIHTPTQAKAFDMQADLIKGYMQVINSVGKEQAAQQEQKFFSPIAFVMAHELAHFVNDARLHNTDEARAAAMATFLTPEVRISPISSAISVFCHSMNDRFMKDAYKSGLLQGMVGEQGVQFMRRLNEYDEFNASFLGFYIAMNAGYDPRGFPQFFQEGEPASFTHPAESETKGALMNMINEAKASGFY